MADPSRIRMTSGDPTLIGTVPAGQAVISCDESGDTPFIKVGSTIYYFTATREQVEDWVGGLLQDSGVIDVTYNDAGNIESFTIVNGSITQAMLNFDPATQVELDALSLAVTNALNGKQDADGTLSALAAQNWALNKIPVGTGADTVTQLDIPVNSFPARASTGNVAAKAVDDAGLAFLAAVGTAAETALLNTATTALKGLQSALDKLKEDNIWLDVTCWSANVADNISAARTGAQNVTAWNTMYAAAAVGTTFYFPPGTYDFAGELACNRDIRMKVKGAGLGRSILNNTSVTSNLFNQSVAGFYIDFEDLGFKSTVTKTAGAAVAASSNNAYLNFRRCEFNNQYRSIDLSSTAGNVGCITECVFGSPSSTAGGSQVRINGSNINMMIQNCTINCTGQDVIGLEINASGAVQVSTCDFIGGRNVLLVNATGVVSALYFSNCFFDQATLGSCVKFMGAGTGGGGQPATSRVKFVECGITNGAAGLAALEIAGTGSGTSIPDGIDFNLCDFYNNGFGGTTTGILATGVRGFDLTNCRISGFTNGIDVTPYSAAGVTNFNISGCTIGPTENFNGNGTGIMIRAGAVAFGASAITDNDLSGNTVTHINDSGLFATATPQSVGQILVNNNIGLAFSQRTELPATLIPLTTPVTRAGSGWSFPANTLRVGTRLRITVALTCAATAQTLTPTLKFGTLNNNTDADLVGAVALGAGTAALGSMICQYDVTVISPTTIMAVAAFLNANITGITNAAVQTRGSAGLITIGNIASTTFYLAPYFVSATAAAVTVRSVTYEVVAQ